MKGIKCVDHLGNEFLSQAKMCEAWNISVLTYRGRLKKGLSQEEALTMPLRDTSVYDHLGNKFPSELQMCKFYNIKLGTFHGRIKRGYSLEQALTEVVVSNMQICEDHLGKTYNSINDMCAAYGLSHQLLKQRLDKGWTIEAALTTPAQELFYDHLGNAFSSKKEMCDHYGITVFTYRYREQNGMNLEEILTTSKNTYIDRYICKDHLGNEYSSVKAMCEAWGVTPAMYTCRLNAGCDIETALTCERRSSYLEAAVSEYLTLHNVEFRREYTFSECKFKNTNRHAKFDFYISDIGVIEVDGKQHFKAVNWFGGLTDFKKTQKRDTLKTNFCETHGIPLLRIRYDQMQDGTYADLIADFIENPAAYITSHNSLSEAEYYAERTENLSVASV